MNSPMFCTMQIFIPQKHQPLVLSLTEEQYHNNAQLVTLAMRGKLEGQIVLDGIPERAEVADTLVVMTVDTMKYCAIKYHFYKPHSIRNPEDEHLQQNP